MANWLIYGATGYTGRLVAQEALKRGHRPVLAGRSEKKLKSLADRLGLEYRVASLDDGDRLMRALSGIELVYHAAGPFVHTSMPMLRACLSAGAHYLDISGEIPVYQNVFAYSSSARENGIAILPGIGFDVLPSDCLLKYAADQLSDATHLDVVVDALNTARGAVGSVSAGTTQSMLEMIPTIGSVVRREGRLVSIPFGAGVGRFRFPHGERLAMPAPWGDVEMGYHSTSIPNITTYLTFSPALIMLFRLTGPLTQGLLRISSVRRLTSSLVDILVSGPSEHKRSTGRSHIFVQVRNAKGETAQAWLETLEAYQFTAVAGVRVVERVLDGSYRGALTPAQAFGTDFVLEIEGTVRRDTLD